MKHTCTISGMSCQGCKSHVTKALENIPEVTKVEVNLEKGIAEISMKDNVELEKFQHALKNAGGNYQISIPTENNTSEEKLMTHSYTISGMSCNGCRSHVEKTLNEVEGVENAKVNLEKGIAEISMKDHIELEKFQQALENAGGNYQISIPTGKNTSEEKLMTHNYHVSGMSCNGCRSHVEKTLNDVEGVENAEVNLEKAEATISMHHHIKIEKFQEALKNDGGGYEIHSADHKHHHSEKTKKKKKPKAKGNGKWYCPMHCEGDKMYDEPRDCPVCGMDLVQEQILSASNTTYTCPMHPEIEEDEPGDCPICGMDLVAKDPEPDAQNSTYLKLRKKFWLSIAFALPIFLIAMSDMLNENPLYQIMDLQYWNWVQFGLSIPVVFYTAWMFFERAWKSIVKWNLNMFTLVGIGSGIAWVFSVLGLLFPDIFPDQFKTEAGTVHVYFEAATVILTLVLLGQMLEARAHDRTNSAIKELLKLAPNKATRIKDGKEEVVAIDEIEEGDILKVKPGEKIPVDGIIKEGKSSIDESMITGEPVPVEKSAEDKITSGTINGNSSFTMIAEQVGDETLLSQIIQMVNDASRSQAPIQRLADKISGYFVPIVVLISVITFVIWAIVGPSPSYVYAFVNAIAVLIIACPCALGLATPMSVMVGIGKGAQNGVLIKNAQALEQMNQIDILIIDKTGTITEGKPSVEKIVSVGDYSEDEIAQFIAALNSHSEHPLASATIKYAKEKEIKIEEASNFDSITGKGVIGEFQQKKLALGNKAILDEMSINTSEKIDRQIEEFQQQGKTVSYLSVANKVEGFVVISDPIKKTSKEALAKLKEDGVDVIMLTGDNERTAKAVADEMEIDFKAGMLPQDKMREVEKLQQQGRKVAAAGDGINDAPALAKADIGIAMGTGTDVAIESAEITLVKGDLKAVLKARKLSDKVMANIKQNLFFALIYNSIGVPIAAGILYPFFGILLSPMIAALAMSFSSVSVIANALRLRAAKLD
ncbi:heavy metal translocating P-type ATPase [Zunongwangia endophytica]|uniref:Heavy metal translocating P-type ATPase n=1 Tax=Zunongwangia endophytica TaxID=1808945 RepID=A0ABV8H8S7_9FLAO|nr:heavy metal translocating P-type ATPase [Zunongwangia endophytica]MDN3596356.1 heavy metal translocating P-type ATPase [Zunongwangia endophytica]